jgi:hypothetical protein
MRTIAILFAFGLAATAGAETAEFVIADGNDDAFTEIHSDTDDITGTSIELGSINGSRLSTAGFRFLTSGIRRGQVIQSATLRLNVEAHGGGTGSTYEMRADTTPDSPDFEAPNPDPGYRGLNSVTSALSYHYDWGTGERNVGFPAAIVQEVINAATWEEGDPLTLLAIGHPPISGSYSVVTSYEGNPVNAAKLILTYDASQFQVPSGATGDFALGDSGAVVSFTEAPDTGGTITIQKVESAPGGALDGSSATTPDSSTITPDVVSQDAYWVITVTGLTGYTYTVTIDTSTLTGINDLDKLVIVKRENSGEDWTPLNTTRNGAVLVASGLNSFSEFSVGAEFATNQLPVELDHFRID